MGFEDALKRVLADEGGYIEIASTGEVANFVITLWFVQGLIDKKATKDYIKNLTLEDATNIYKKYFWEAPKLDKVKDDKVASLMFYLGVNCGAPTMIYMTQLACIELGAKISADRFMGPSTLDAINSRPADKLHTVLSRLAEERYRSIAQNPKQAIFLAGWLKRLKRYKDDVVA